ncbi:MAG: hypothetical protein F6K54_26125 [Okeania sp. SIO3B5]|nr:hypothetical protein [Okeania sp. SIO3B5]
MCSNCGFKGGKLDLKVREWECLNCGAKHVLRRECSDKYISRGRAVRDEKAHRTRAAERRKGTRSKKRTWRQV